MDIDCLPGIEKRGGKMVRKLVFLALSISRNAKWFCAPSADAAPELNYR